MCRLTRCFESSASLSILLVYNSEWNSNMFVRFQVDDMIRFLQTYIENDQVGSIANAHLAHADRYDIFHEQCLNIAKKFSVAVDFAKNGSSRSLDRDQRPQQYPDFMEKYHKTVYKSQKALGKMYRVCRDFESENEETSVGYHDIKVWTFSFIVHLISVTILRDQNIRDTF